MAAASTLAIAGLVVSAVGTGIGYMQQQKAQKQQEKQFKESSAEAARGRAAEKQLADLQTVRAKRAAAREAQIRRADIQSGAEATGASGSSSARGATGSVTTQGSSNISFLDQANKLNSTAATAFGNAQEISRRPIFTNDTFGSATKLLGGTLFAGREEISAFMKA